MKRIDFKKLKKLEYTRAEQLNSISVNLDFCGDDIKVINVTSTHENEGKSFVSMHLWRTCARNGKRVILLDCDLRKSRIIRDYEGECDEEIVGITHYLAGLVPLEDIVYKTNIRNADIIPVGKNVSNPINLLKKPRFEKLIEELRKHYDLIIIDTPPVQPVIDSAYISQKCDGTILVVNYGDATVYEILETKNQLLAAHATILGVVLNSVPYNSGRFYYKTSKYYNRYRYKYYKSNFKYKSYSYGPGYYTGYYAYGNTAADDEKTNKED